MKKRNLKKQAKGTVINSQTVVNSSQSDEKLYKLLIKWFTWEKIVGLATIISAVIAVYLLKPPSELEKTRTNIYHNIGMIKSDFHSEWLKSSFNNHPDAKMVYVFQESVLKFVYKFEALESLPSICEYKDQTTQELQNLILSRMDLKSQSNNAFNNVIISVDSLMTYGINNQINNYIPNRAKWQTLMTSAKRRNSVVKQKGEEAINNFNNLVEKYGEDIVPPKEEVIKAFQPIEDLRNSLDYYLLTQDAIAYFIELNQLYEMQIRSYQMRIMQSD